MYAENDCAPEQELIAHVCTVFKQFGLSEYEAYSRATKLVHFQRAAIGFARMASGCACGDSTTEGRKSSGFPEYARLLVGVSRLHSAGPSGPATRDARITALISSLLQAEREEVISHSASRKNARLRLLKHLKPLQLQRKNSG